jgi:DNA mismatch repair protein MutS
MTKTGLVASYMHPSEATPMMKQYLAIKSENPDALLFYRMGDFYEMFFEDAQIASPVLDIALTSRNKTNEFPVPMCGVPYRAVQGYISKLIDQGFKVALCDQTEDASLAKGLVRREVVRVITPGMLLEDVFLDGKTNNFILALCCIGNAVGLSCLDISTGAFRVTQSETWGVIKDEISRISPREILLPKAASQEAAFDGIRDMLVGKAVTYTDDPHFEFRTAREKLIEQFQTHSLEGFGCESLTAGVGAAGALMAYVQDTQKQAMSHVSRIETYFQSQFLLVDDVSCRNLELMKTIQGDTRKGTLLNVLDHTMTAMGGRRLKNWLRYPLMDTDKIRQRLDAVEEAVSRISLTHAVRDILKKIGDIERLSGKIVMNRCNARDLLALGMSIEALPDIRRCLSDFTTELFQWDLFGPNLQALETLATLIRNAIREDASPVTHEGDMIRSGFHAGLDELIQISRDGKGWLAKLEAEQRQITGIQTLKVRYNKVFGYFIEVSKNQSSAVPAHYVRKQTLVNAERYITDELKTFENKILHAEEERAALEYQIFMDVRKTASDSYPAIQQAADMVASLDCLLGLACVADQYAYVRPEIRTDGILSIEDGRHPVIEQMIAGERFVPNSIFMDNAEHQVLIITGPNMAGKSTILRQVALQVLMAQMGSFVPAKSAAISVTDRIFTRVGALDNLSSGQSTFMVEMQETANILNGVTPRSLVIMDEIGRGTSTFDGFSIAWAVVCYLHDLWDKGVKTLFATHYHELTALEQIKPRVKNYNISVKEWQDQIVFLRKLVEGGASRSYGIQVARLAGIPEVVVRHAKTILNDIESGNHQFQKTLSLNAEKKFLKPAPAQLALFPEPENAVIEKLVNIEITSMTPLDALNCLNELRHEAIQTRN